MRIRRLVFACLSTLAVCECAFGDGAKELAQLTSHSADGGSKAASEGLGFHGQHAHPPHPNDGLHASHPGAPSSGMPDDIYGYVEKAQPQGSDKDLLDKWSEEATFELPRLPHPEEWKIKTCARADWRLGKIQTREFSFVLEDLPVSKESWMTRLTNKMKLGRTEQTPEIPYPSNLIVAWVSKIAPIFSQDPLVKDSYILGGEIHKSRKTGSVDQIKEIKEKLMERLYGEKLAAAYSEEDRSKLNDYVASDAHLKILELLYLKRNDLMGLHERMQSILNRVVLALGGEKQTSETFKQIIQYHRKLISEEGRIGDEPKKVDPELFSQITPFPFLRQLDPAGYKMHLSPLLFLEEVLTHLEKDSTIALKAASGYLGSTPRIEVLRSAAGEVNEYAKLSREVDTLQNKVLELRDHVQSVRKSDFKDADTMEKQFNVLLNHEKVYPGIKEKKEGSPS
ncbi:hypothetical protein VP01_4051g1 [Puccinia sorghi]|uniref:Uncharacterized protein n=1 Tax=Puccinia sorghi TaxID=27349 RepID=A0A0L6URQ2_9BASI|nr:hypothetical protein VP01_4051g1 [Puccinia sorghi]